MSGIDRSKLPDLIPTNSVLGNVSAKAAEELGLSTNTIVVAGCGDVHSAAIGSGAVEDYKPHFYIGTSSWLVCHLPNKKTDMDHNMATLPSAILGRYMLVNEQECAGSCIQFFRDKVLFRKDGLTPQGFPEDYYKIMNELAAEVPAGSDGLLFIPHLYGERSPVEDHYARGAFYNLSLKHDRRHMIRAIMEGVALNGKWLLKYVEKNSGRKAEAVNLIGGGANSELWCQIIADVFNRPVRQMENPVIANSQGAAYLAAYGLGNMTLDEIAAAARYKKEFTPNPQNTVLYDKAFEEFLGYYQRNKKAHKRMNGH
jgi:xylulokinase